MCSYNRLNGTYLSDNKRFLNDVLRDEWGYDGIVVSDWGAVNDRAEGVKAGMDLEMPGSKGCGLNGDTVYKALEAGTLTEEDIDKDVLRLIRFAYENTVREVEGVTFDVEKHNDIARRAAEGGAVLLKNDGILPLNKNKVSPSSADSQNKSAIKAVVRATFFPQNLHPSPTRSTKSDKNTPTPTATFSKAKATKRA